MPGFQKGWHQNSSGEWKTLRSLITGFWKRVVFIFSGMSDLTFAAALACNFIFMEEQKVGIFCLNDFYAFNIESYGW